MERLNASQAQSSRHPSTQEIDTLNLATQYSTIAKDLKVELEKLTIDKSKDGHRQAISKAVRSIRKSRMLKEKQAKLDKYRQTLDSLLLMKLDTQSLRRSRDIDSLDQSVRELVFRVERGQNTTTQLLADQTRQIQDYLDRKLDVRDRQSEIAQAREKFVASLFFPEIDSRQDQIVDAFEGTCKWIFDPLVTEERHVCTWPSFRNWLLAETGVYWISGKPGSGKSTLMRYIVNEPQTTDDLSAWEEESDLIVISFFFWNLGTELQRSLTGLLRSLLLQITNDWPDMMNLVLMRYGQRGEQSIRLSSLPIWTNRRLLNLLKDFIDQKPDTISLCAFIDGLDEFDGDEDVLLEVIRLLRSAPKCKICVSSRPEQVFHTEYQGNPQCRVQDLNRKDIEKMAVERLKPSLEKYRLTEGRRIDIMIEDLIEKAEGVFLWLNLMIKDLIKGSRNGDSVAELHGRLQRTPNTIGGLYKRILQGLDPLYLQDALKVFQFLIAANSIGTSVSILGLACTQETQWAHIQSLDHTYFVSSAFKSVCIELYTRLSSRCGNLIDIPDFPKQVEGANLIQYCQPISFIHKTAVEFLREEYSNTFSESSWFAAAGATLARAKIGSIFLFPLTGSSEVEDVVNSSSEAGESEQVSELRRLFTGAMAAISLIEYSVLDLDPKRPPDSAAADLTAQIWRVLQHMGEKDDTVGIETSTRHPSMKGITSKMERYFTELTHLHHSFSDPMCYAAFWGGRSYILSRLSTDTSDKEYDDMLDNALCGLRNPQVVSGVLVIQIVLTLNILLSKSMVRRSKTSHWKPYRLPHRKLTRWRASLWGTIFMQIYSTSISIDLKGFDRGQTMWITCCMGLIKRSLDLGADPNTRIGSNTEVVLDEENLDRSWTLYVDESPLAMIEDNPTWSTVLEEEMKSLFSAQGAIHRRRFRFCSCNKSYYRINCSQSDRLKGLVYPSEKRFRWMIYLSSSDNMEQSEALFNEIVSADNRVGWDVFEKEWKKGGSDWPEEDIVHAQQQKSEQS